MGVLGAISVVTGLAVYLAKPKTAGVVGLAARDEMANCKTNGHANVLSVGREEAQEQENGHDEGPPWVWRCPAARRGEGRRLREGEGGAVPLVEQQLSKRISSDEKGTKAWEIDDFSTGKKSRYGWLLQRAQLT